MVVAWRRHGGVMRALRPGGGGQLTSVFCNRSPPVPPIIPFTLLQEAGIPYQVEVLMEATDESVSGVGDSICKRAEELGAAAVSWLLWVPALGACRAPIAVLDR